MGESERVTVVVATRREGRERGRERKRDSHSLTHRMEESENFTFVWGVIMIYYVTLKRLGGSRVSLGSGRMSPETTRKRYEKDSENEDGREGERGRETHRASTWMR